MIEQKIAEIVRRIHGDICNNRKATCNCGNNRQECQNCYTDEVLALIAEEQAVIEVQHRKELARIEQVHEASKFLELSAKDRQMRPLVEALEAARKEIDGVELPQLIEVIDTALKGVGR